MSLAFIWNIKSLPHLALCIFYLIKIEADISHVFPLFIVSRECRTENLASSLDLALLQIDVISRKLGNIKLRFCDL